MTARGKRVAKAKRVAPG